MIETIALWFVIACMVLAVVIECLAVAMWVRFERECKREDREREQRGKIVSEAMRLKGEPYVFKDGQPS